MRYFKLTVIILFLLGLIYQMLVTKNYKLKLQKNLRCLICQGQSVYDSDSEFANSLKVFVKNELNNGKTEIQIYDDLKEKYGDWILYDPEFNKNTFFLVITYTVILNGGAIIFKLFIIKKN